MRKKLQFTIACIALSSGLAIASGGSPNILFIAVDDLRPQANFYGQKQMLTPAMDRLAAASVVFTRAYCSVPVCGASRASLLSGARPTRERFVNFHTRKDVDFPGQPSLPAWLKQHGYTTISNGKIYHHSDDDLGAWSETPWMPDNGGLGWQSYITEESKRIIEANRGADQQGRVLGPSTEMADVPDNAYPDGLTAEKAVADLERLARTGDPFFLAVGFVKPHLPFAAPKKYWDLYDREQLKLAPNPFRPKDAPDAAMHNFGELRNGYSDVPLEGPVSDELALKLIHGYYACVSYTDAQVGKVLQALEENGLAGNTVVILWGDHGWHLGEHGLWCKHANFDLTMNAPLLVSAPGAEKGIQTSALTEFIDIYPTLCELAGLPLPGHLDGRSFADELMSPDQHHKDYVFCRYHEGESIITNSFIYTEWRDNDDAVFGRMLYDHRNDPGENVNIVDQPGYEPVVQYMEAALNEVKALAK